ncbi:MAG: CDP-alcohol phosphatidyltransferase family protein [Clostridia bacterium]|nr:CDP-alcohol phosphatidyltransferase family protein [Clostridia bacterium]
MRNIPNILTFLRLLLVPLFACSFFLISPTVALVLFLLAGTTDILDGYLARRFHWGSTLGKVLDPVADKSMQCTVLVVLTVAGYIPLLLMIPFVLKEAIQLFCGLLFFRFRHDVTVSCWYGKLAICIFYATVSMTILCPSAWQSKAILLPAAWIVTLLLMLGALLGYVVRYTKIANRMKNNI